MTDNMGYTTDGGGSHPTGLNGYGLGNGFQNGDDLEKGKNGYMNGSTATNFSTSDSDREAEAQAIRDQKPFFYCRWVAERPGRWFGKSPEYLIECV